MLYRWEMGARRSGPDPHFHGSISESFYLLTPGAPREDYFETLADAAHREAMDDEARAAFYLRHDTFWVDAG